MIKEIYIMKEYFKIETRFLVPILPLWHNLEYFCKTIFHE
jgi:hypothetical protein